MSRSSVATTLWAKRRSRCPAGSVSTAAGKRCAPGRGDAGLCTAPLQGLREVKVAAALPPRGLRRLNRTVRAVCRLWWEADAHDHQELNLA
ncbi:MAG TPA: hypothetical protein VH105_12590 [Burkholderiales bacterium]|nr:hypothetical protein [Burkholderiales bacterium]